MRRAHKSLPVVFIALFQFAFCPSAPLAAVSSQPGFSVEEVRQARQDPGYFTIDPKSVVIENMGKVMIAPEKEDSPAGFPSDPVGDIGKIINIGKEIWSIIEANKPVVDIKTDWASALPDGVTQAQQLSGWSQPEATMYGLHAKNLYGVEVVNINWAVLRTWGGRYHGKGRYLTGVTVKPLDKNVIWGYRFSLAASASSLTNAGTDQDPIAGMQLALDWTIRTPLKEEGGGDSYYLQGDGLFKNITSPAVAPSFNPELFGLSGKPQTIPW